MKRILILLVCLGVCLWAVAYAVFDILAFRMQACISLRLAAVAAIAAAFGVLWGLIWCVEAIVNETEEKGEEEDNDDE